jgi:signal transduction histidine kinase
MSLKTTSITQQPEAWHDIRYDMIFRAAPVSIWIEDFSQAKLALDELSAQGISDFRRYFDKERASLARVAQLVKVCDVNDATLRLYGVEKKEQLLGSLNQILVPESLRIFEEELIAIAEGKLYFEGEFVSKTLPGDSLNILLHLVVPGEPPDFSRVIVTITDITERKAAEQAVLERTKELERSNQELEQFAYVASHDLQEPLRMVSSYTQLLARRYKGQLDSDADEFIAFAVDGAQRMQLLINDLLGYSRVSRKGQPFKAIDCETVLKRTLAMLRQAISENNATITHDPLPTIIADGRQLLQLFQNLISNALKYRSQKPLKIHIGFKSLADGAGGLFWVEDNGIGIEPQYAPRIFIIFQRLHSRAEYPGTGIGLAICKKIVERHGGRLWVESDLGKGATFYFTISNTQ